MARKKEYIEAEVIDKAMALFWRNGFETTSLNMLEKEMGINKFSIYASFGSKIGVFLESIKSYRRRLSQITDKLEISSNGVAGLKQYFYDFIDFSKENECGKGCLIVNTAIELGENADTKIKEELAKFTSDIRQLFIDNLKQEPEKDAATIEKQADYLIISMFGLAAASKMFNRTQLEHYIENIFENI